VLQRIVREHLERGWAALAASRFGGPARAGESLCGADVAACQEEADGEEVQRRVAVRSERVRARSPAVELS
jgi:hypothetical protein